MSWEYQKINLNEVPRKSNEIDVLCGAGEEGWELVAILENNIAYLKREVEEEKTAFHVEPKYRDTATGETWSGRGRMATYMAQAQTRRGRGYREVSRLTDAVSGTAPIHFLQMAHSVESVRRSQRCRLSD